MDWSKIVECAKKVYKELGCGHSESIYQKALSIEFQNNNIHHTLEDTFPIRYNDKLVGFCRSDITLYTANPRLENDESENDFSRIQKHILELKSIVNEPSVVEFVQIRNYIRELELKEGLLINFPLPSKTQGIPTGIHAVLVSLTDNGFSTEKLN